MSNIVFTETENSYNSRNHRKNWNTSSDSSEYYLHFTCSVSRWKIYGSLAVNFSKLSHYSRSGFIELPQPWNSNNSPVFSTFGHGFSDFRHISSQIDQNSTQPRPGFVSTTLFYNLFAKYQFSNL